MTVKNRTHKVTQLSIPLFIQLYQLAVQWRQTSPADAEILEKALVITLDGQPPVGCEVESLENLIKALEVQA